jgi:hypothetical protein
MSWSVSRLMCSGKAFHEREHPVSLKPSRAVLQPQRDQRIYRFRVRIVRPTRRQGGSPPWRLVTAAHPRQRFRARRGLPTAVSMQRDSAGRTATSSPSATARR